MSTPTTKDDLHASDTLHRAFSELLRSGFVFSLPAQSQAEQKILIGWGDWSKSATASPTGPSLLTPDFYLRSDRPWRMTANWELVDRDRFATHVLAAKEHIVKFKDQGFQWVEPNLAEFKEKWTKIRDGMRDRGVSKGVPVVFAEAKGSIGSDRKISLLAHLLSLPPQLHWYGFWENDAGYLGATPETLFSQDSWQELQTMALAGTKPRGPRAPQELLEDAKERHEHQLVVNDLVEVLSAVGQVEVGETGVVELPTLCHLKTPVRVRKGRDLTFHELARLLHPTPALGVAPRRLGFEEMLHWDSETRGRFGAPFGVELRSEDGEFVQRHCVVAIRGVQWQDGRLRIGSGCGIVPESQLESEWQELANKRESVKRMLGL